MGTTLGRRTVEAATIIEVIASSHHVHGLRHLARGHARCFVVAVAGASFKVGAICNRGSATSQCDGIFARDNGRQLLAASTTSWSSVQVVALWRLVVYAKHVASGICTEEVLIADVGETSPLH